MGEPLLKTMRVACSVEHAFQVFTSRIDAWWPPGHHSLEGSHIVLEPMVGGRFYERTDAGEEVELGRVLVSEPPKRIKYTWRPGSTIAPTEVEVSFLADGEATLVRVDHREAESQLRELWPNRVKKFDQAWDAVLPALARFIEREG